MRAYIDGVEINKIPEMAEICKMDDWLKGLLDWAKANRPEMRCDLIIQADAPSIRDGALLEVWIGGAPRLRAQEIGGILQSLNCSPKSK
jgi:hypothetical protein